MTTRSEKKRKNFNHVINEVLGLHADSALHASLEQSGYEDISTLLGLSNNIIGNMTYMVGNVMKKVPGGQKERLKQFKGFYSVECHTEERLIPFNELKGRDFDKFVDGQLYQPGHVHVSALFHRSVECRVGIEP